MSCILKMTKRRQSGTFITILAISLTACDISPRPDVQALCRKLARSIEDNHSKYMTDLDALKLKSIDVKYKKSKSEEDVRSLNKEVLSVVQKRKSFLQQSLFGPEASPLRCGCEGVRLESLQTVGKLEMEQLDAAIAEFSKLSQH